MKQDPTDPKGRRAFLKASAAAGVAAALLPGVAAAVDEPAAGPAPGQVEKKGYRESRHVLDYYKAARL